MPKKYIDILDQLLKNSKWNGECLESTNRPGKSGRIYITHKRKMISAPRASWKCQKGEIPKGLFVCHKCDNPKCIRIDHLFLGTPGDNMRDMVAKRRDNAFGNRRYPLACLDEAKKLRGNGFTCRVIADKLGMTRSSVESLMSRHNVKAGPSHPRKRKFTAEVIDRIYQMKDEGFTYDQIVEKTGASLSTLWLIFKKRKGIK